MSEEVTENTTLKAYRDFDRTAAAISEGKYENPQQIAAEYLNSRIALGEKGVEISEDQLQQLLSLRKNQNPRQLSAWLSQEVERLTAYLGKNPQIHPLLKHDLFNRKNPVHQKETEKLAKLSAGIQELISKLEKTP